MINAKIKNLKQLALIIKKLRKKNKTIGFTNGCFDIIHAGHVKYLEAAKKKCRILVVALNTDSSVKRVKGDKRPITPLKGRLTVIAALESTDYVVPFKEKTPLKIIKLLKPDVIIKGADWKKTDIVGSDFVKSYGGKTAVISFLKGYSTSGIIKSIIKDAP
ncbi:MAG: D-glycero-beta-D-manno-heptose 1-phosphate adenylyltransferase, partial [Candidatus Omnitrophica bacterium]|nr:D-glycero-beta-D-manno-heptose 1-phosphate adenylyltransferase [Candidatus Omnitrophota bacterium]